MQFPRRYIKIYTLKRRHSITEMGKLESFICGSTSQGVLLLRADGRVLFANQAARKLLSLAADPAASHAALEDLGAVEPKGIWQRPASRKEMLFTREGRQARLIISTEVRDDSVIVFLEEATPEGIRALQQETVYPVLVSIIAGIGPEVRDRAAALARSDIPAVIGGESGTGKEVLARAIHLSSKRSGGPFTVVDCSSLPATLIESELFGYEPGTFTGAKREGRPGKFELAHGGTLFLDEVGDMPLELQSRLLRILNDHQVMRLGGSRAKRVDIRILASTNKELRAMVAAGTFREDLFHRIMGAEIVLPPLRERMEHFDELVELFVEKHGHGRSYWMEPQAMEAMRAYRWPGNIRELEKCVEYITAMKPGGRVDKADLPENVFHECPDTDGNTFREKMRRYEHQLLMQALARSDYNITRTAKELGLSRRGLQKKMDKAGVGVVKDRRSKKGG